MNIGGALSVIVAALAILGAAGSAFAFLSDRTNRDRLNGLRSDVTDRNERIDFLESENDRKDKTIEAQHAEINELKGKVSSLEQYRDAQAGPLLQMTEQIAQLHDLVRAHHDTAKAGFELLEKQHSEELGLLGNRRNMPAESVIREVGDA